MANVAIVGLGNLGSRHLQGLVRCSIPLRIALYDPSEASVATAKQRWEEAGGLSSVHALTDGNLPDYDLAIVATTADVRPLAVGALSNSANVGSWLIEKPISQSTIDGQRVAESIGDAPAWVNLPRRAMPWHQAMAQEIRALSGPLTVSVSGGPWGLACNAIHFVDLVCWWSDSEPVAVDVSGLADRWHPSKRLGYVEIFGRLAVAFADGTELILQSVPNGGAHVIDANSLDASWRIAEQQGLSWRNGEPAISGRMSFQSALTGSIVEAILSGGRPPLPSLNQARQLESVLLEALIRHRASVGGPTDRLDVT